MPGYNDLVARRRFFVDQIREGMAEMRGEDAHHLARVLRAEAGRTYEVSDGSSVWLAEIIDARPDRVVFRCIEPVESPELPAHITLCASLVKFDRFEWIVEKATELGVERIIPVEAARSEKGLAQAAAKRRERWQRIALESSQQSRRARVPEILPAVRYQEALRTAADFRYFLDEASTAPILGAFPAARQASDCVAVLTGTEGGWTDEERAGALAAGWTPVSLGSLILRAETAVTAALAVIGAAWVKRGGGSASESAPSNRIW